MRVLALIIALLLLCETTLAQNCPPCYYDQYHMVARHGYDGDGRQKLNVYIDWSSMPNFTQSGKDTVTAAVDGGIAQWNNATNPNVSSNAWDYKIQYGLERTTVSSQADFIVRRGSTLLDCISIDMSVYPHVITFGDNWFNSSSAERIAGIAHELGHRFGLGHPSELSNNSGCSTGDSIMQGSTTLICTGGSTQVTAKDVAQKQQEFRQSSAL
ncbi:MAG TPA: hypothetical protein VFZ22_14175 [Pyrinomonadaceae bacterium]|nr:hypothetical protein [Pyrinomonadaceae bacterium]